MNKPLKWSTFIDRAKDNGYFSRRAKERVQEWETCAIGEHEALLSDEVEQITGVRGYNNQHGPYLRQMGVRFMERVLKDQVYSARRLYQAINRTVRAKGLA